MRLQHLILLAIVSVASATAAIKRDDIDEDDPEYEEVSILSIHFYSSLILSSYKVRSTLHRYKANIFSFIQCMNDCTTGEDPAV